MGGYAIDHGDTEGKTIKCRQKKKKLKNYCAKDFFSSVCRKKCSLCTPIVPTTNPISDPEVCDNGDGYAIDPDDTKRKQIKCGQNQKNLQNYCSKDFFSSVCRKKCALCIPTVPTTNPTSDPEVCDNGDGYAIDPVDTKRKQIKCGQNQKNLQNYCSKDFFSSVCRKKCALC